MASQTQSYTEALGKQMFARDYILNGLHPCQSDIVKMFLLTKIDWRFNDKFEYRMLLANTDTSNSVNTQLYKSDFSLQNPGQNTFGIFQAQYGVSTNGFFIDMNKQLETKEQRAAFQSAYSTEFHAARISSAAFFKNVIIKGRYAPVHRILPIYRDDETSPEKNLPKIRKGDTGSITSASPIWNDSTNVADSFSAVMALGDSLIFEAPIDVFHSGYKTGRLLSYAAEELKPRGKFDADTELTAYTSVSEKRFTPWGKSYVNDCWVVVQNQPKMFEIALIGYRNKASTDTTTATLTFNAGACFEVLGNRKANKDVWSLYTLTKGASGSSAWSDAGFNVSDYQNLGDTSDVRSWRWSDGSNNSTLRYYSEASGAMEGMADLFPWYTRLGATGTNISSRFGLNRFFRGARNRLSFTAEQSGMLFYQKPNQSIMNAILEGVALARGTVSWEDQVVWMNPDTMAAIGLTEQQSGSGMGQGMITYKEAQIDSKLIYQRGITATTFRIGNQIIPNAVADYNLPTDVIVIAPLRDIQYNCWDNAAAQMDQYIMETWAGKEPPDARDLKVPNEFASKLDVGQRIVYGSPVSGDLSLSNPFSGNAIDTNYTMNPIVHPSNALPCAYYEMGALFTPNPHAYTIVKLRNQIVNISDVLDGNWDLDKYIEASDSSS